MFAIAAYGVSWLLWLAPDHIEGGVEKMKRTGRKLIGMAAAVLLMASAFCTAVYAADGFSSEYERLLDTAYIFLMRKQMRSPGCWMNSVNARRWM